MIYTSLAKAVKSGSDLVGLGIVSVVSFHSFDSTRKLDPLPALINQKEPMKNSLNPTATKTVKCKSCGTKMDVPSKSEAPYYICQVCVDETELTMYNLDLAADLYSLTNPSGRTKAVIYEDRED